MAIREGWNELKEDYEESYDFTRGKTVVTTKFHGPWTDRNDFINEDLITHREVQPNGDLILVGGRHPEFRDAFVKSIKVNGAGKPNKLGPDDSLSFSNAIISVIYETPDYQNPSLENPDFENTELITVEVEEEQEILEYDGRSLETANGDKASHLQRFQFRSPIIRFNITLHQVTSGSLVNSIQEKVGKVNSDFVKIPLVSVDFNSPPERLLFETFGFTIVRNVLGFTAYNVRLSLVRRVGLTWNEVVDKDGSIQKIFKVEGLDNVPVYDSTTLTDLLTSVPAG